MPNHRRLFFFRQGFGVWVPIESFYQQFKTLIENKKEAADVEELLVDVLDSPEFRNKDQKTHQNAFRCGISGILLQTEFYRQLHTYQNDVRR